MSGDAVPLAVAMSPAALTLEWPDGATTLPAARLRASCRCAECASSRLRGIGPAVAADIALADARPVGHYAVQLVFSDGHERGIYPWGALRSLG